MGRSKVGLGQLCVGADADANADAATAGADDAAADAAVTDARRLISFSLLSKPATSVISKIYR